MSKVKHIYVNGKLVGIGSVKIEEIEKEPEYFLKIVQDDCTSYPYEGDESVILFSNHKSYDWNDSKLEELLNKFEEVPKNVDELVELLNKAGEYYYVAVYGYDHSGLSVSLTPFSCNWDSGLLGILRIDKSFTDPQKVAENWVKTINMWLHGDVYCVRVVNELGECVDDICSVYVENVKDVKEAVKDYLSREYHFTDEDYKTAWEERTYI